MESKKEQVKAFWEREACGERYGVDQDRLRYELEPEILEFADFGASTGRRVLEIGVGMGADLLLWARAGAVVTGVDLTQRAVDLTVNRLAEQGLTAHIQVADAEALPFPDNHFDIVYSWGVLHHTPDPAKALAEAQRVLARGGQLRVMLYHRHSWVALAAWARFCLFRGRPLNTLRDAVARIESPGTRAFTQQEVLAMLTCGENPIVAPHLTRWDRRLAPGLSALFGDRFGWFLLAQCDKTAG